ncbi:hypothetical protein FM106_19620 [Brachybacterium faecium]|nr:hypothetical protein FM106_19620 [Brachybacterium faecium]
MLIKTLFSMNLKNTKEMHSINAIKHIHFGVLSFLWCNPLFFIKSCNYSPINIIR